LAKLAPLPSVVVKALGKPCPFAECFYHNTAKIEHSAKPLPSAEKALDKNKDTETAN